MVYGCDDTFLARITNLCPFWIASPCGACGEKDGYIGCTYIITSTHARVLLVRLALAD